MAGPYDFGLVAMCARGIPPFQAGIDGPAFVATATQLGLLFRAGIEMSVLNV